MHVQSRADMRVYICVCEMVYRCVALLRAARTSSHGLSGCRCACVRRSVGQRVDASNMRICTCAYVCAQKTQDVQTQLA